MRGSIQRGEKYVLILIEKNKKTTQLLRAATLLIRQLLDRRSLTPTEKLWFYSN